MKQIFDPFAVHKVETVYIEIRTPRGNLVLPTYAQHAN